MASTRKSRSLNKRISKFNEDSPEKEISSGIKGKQQKKRKLSDMLGTQWSKEELEKFYAGYRKYGKDWMKVASFLRNRSVEMVEALYNMNRAYLSLPEGTASVVGLIAMMTDHYNIMEGSESERESNEGPQISRKPQKRARGKFRPVAPKVIDTPVPDLLQSQLSLMKKTHSDGTQPRAVGKRTPRYPVSYVYGKYNNEKFLSPIKQRPVSEVNTNDDEVAHGAVMVLAEALQRGDSPQVTRTSNRRKEVMLPSPSWNKHKMNADNECLESSLSSKEAENGDLNEESSTMGGQRKGKKSNSRTPKLQELENGLCDDGREACSGTEEGPTFSFAKEKIETEVTGRRNGSSRRRNRQLFEDERSALDALYTLADVSTKMVPISPDDSDKDSSMQFKEDRLNDTFEKSSTPEGTFTGHHRGKARSSGAKVIEQNISVEESSLKQPKSGKDLVSDLNESSKAKPTINLRKGKRRPAESKVAILCNKTPDDLKVEVPTDEGKNPPPFRSKRIGQIPPFSKQRRSAKSEKSSSFGDLLRLKTDPEIRANAPTKVRSRRKMDPRKMLIKDLKSSENVVDGKPRSFYDSEIDLKEKISHCLSSKLLRRWCGYEFFYNAIDYPWFAKNEFLDYLKHVELGYVQKLTRVEWGVIRSSLGKPRRLSEHFLKEEKGKLEQYRQDVRKQYTELREGTREGLPADLARPLSVGQCVIAYHPKTRELHDGVILNVDENRCRVQFDRSELGVAFVMDVDCMPLNPLDNRPEDADQLYLNNTLQNVNNPLSATLFKQVKIDTFDAVSQAKAIVSEITNAQKATCTQPYTLAQIQAKQADVRALVDLTRALDKKESVVLELKYMNDLTDDKVQEESENTANIYVKGSESFKTRYAQLLLQLKQVNVQVSETLLSLRKRNTYQGSVPPPWPKQIPDSGGSVGPLNTFEEPSSVLEESEPRVVEILESSKAKARELVATAFQAMGSIREGEDAFTKVGEALDLTVDQKDGLELSMSAVRTSSIPDTSINNFPYRDISNSFTSEVASGNCPNLNSSFEPSKIHNPSELISSCVATLLKIQACTERQYPPAEVAQILDSAVSSLQPCSSQNMPIYREIQMCMGVIKTQILALIPT